MPLHVLFLNFERNNELRIQARRQDSVTGGAEINFGGAREVYFCEFQRGTGAQDVVRKFKGIFRPKSEIQVVFPAESK